MKPTSRAIYFVHVGEYSTTILYEMVSGTTFSGAWKPFFCNPIHDLISGPVHGPVHGPVRDAVCGPVRSDPSFVDAALERLFIG